MDPVVERMRAVFELRELTIAMRREVLAREHPNDTAAQISARLRDWVLAVIRDHPHQI